jgi:hypothetical protein
MLICIPYRMLIAMQAKGIIFPIEHPWNADDCLQQYFRPVRPDIAPFWGWGSLTLR